MRGRFAFGSTARRLLVRTMVAVLVLAALVWIVTMSGIGMGLVIPWALARAAPEGWTVRVGAVEGAWNRRVHVRDFAMHGPDYALSANAVLLEYRLLPLLRRTIDVRTIHLSGPVFEGVLGGAPQPADTVTDPTDGRNVFERLLSGSPLGQWTLRIAELRVDDARAVLESSAGTYRIERADLAGATNLSPDATRFSV